MPVTRIETIASDRINPLKVGFVDGLSDYDIAEYQLKIGDVLFSHINSEPQIGRTALYEGTPPKLLHGMNLLLLRPSSSIDAHFLHFALRHLRETGATLALASRAVGQSSINQGRLKTLQIPFPDIAEQRQVALVLSAVQRAIERQERLIALTAELKKALMHKLFTEGTRGEPLKHTEIGPGPESWKLQPVGSVCSSIVPGRNKPKFFDGDIPWLTTPEIKGLTYITDSLPARRVTREHLKEVGGRVVPPNSVIMTCVGDFGIVVINRVEVVINQQLHAFICPEDLDPYFLCQMLRTRVAYMEGLAQKTTVPYLNKSKCESIPIALPTVAEQKEIASVLEAVDSKAEEELARRECVADLFRTLLHQLMTAQIRVHDLDLSALDEPEVEPAEVA